MRRLGWIALLLVASAAVLIAFARRGELKSGEEVTVGFRYHWKPGMAYVYSLVIDAANQTAIAPPASGSANGMATPSLHGNLHLDGELVIRWRGMSGGDPVLGLRLRRLGSVQFRLVDRDVFADEAAARQALEDVEVLLIASDRGEPKSLHFDPSASPVAKNLLQMIVSELQATGPEGDDGRWSLAETDQHGTARVRYAVTSANEQEIAVEKRKESYISLRIMGGGADARASRQEIEGGAQIRLATPGHLFSLSLSETLRMHDSDGTAMLEAKTKIEQRLLRIEAEATTPLNDAWREKAEARRPDQVVLAKDAERKLLEQQADGIAMSEVVDGIRGYVSGRRGSEHHRWLWRTVGLLRLQPARCQELATLFAKDSSIDRRELLLDLFAATGHEQAQSAMRQLISVAEETVDPGDYAMMLQRFSFTSTPTSDSGEFIFDRYQRMSGDLKTAATYTLGSIAGNLQRAGETDLAREYLSALESDLSSASAPSDREALILGIGNAKRKESAGVLVRYSADPEVGVRMAVAEALRDTQSPQSEAMLFGLSADPNAKVQQIALRSLGTYELSAEHLTRLRTLVLGGSVAPENYPALMALLIRGPVDRSSAEITEYMLAHSATRPDLQPQLKQLLAQLER